MRRPSRSIMIVSVAFAGLCANHASAQSSRFVQDIQLASSWFDSDVSVSIHISDISDLQSALRDHPVFRDGELVNSLHALFEKDRNLSQGLLESLYALLGAVDSAHVFIKFDSESNQSQWVACVKLDSSVGLTDEKLTDTLSGLFGYGLGENDSNDQENRNAATISQGVIPLPRGLRGDENLFLRANSLRRQTD